MEIAQKESRQDGCPPGSSEADCWFALGVDRQERAAAASTDEEKRALLEEAKTFYERLLKPSGARRGAVLNNLAQVYAGLGQEERAEDLFRSAISLESDPLQPFYHRNYADFLARRGKGGRAAEHYRKTLEAEPDDFHAHQALVAILERQRPEVLAEYLWFLIARGQVSWAEEVALNRLDPGVLPAEAEEEYLAILAGALAGRSYRAEEFPSSRAARVLAAVVERSGGAGEGAREVLRLHAGKDFEPASYAWWAERRKPTGGAAGGPSPRQVFRRLIRARGDAERGRAGAGSAREYFRLAVLLSREEPDLLAFRKLVDLPSAIAEVDAVDRLAQWNEEVLRRTGAPQEDLYLYRHDLGLLYGFLGRWGGKGEDPASGIFQLARATRIADSGGVGPPDGPPETPTFDARIYSRLAAGYAATGKPDRAMSTLQGLVAAYRAHGLEAEAAALELVLGRGRGSRAARRIAGEKPSEILDDPPLLPRDARVEPPKPPPGDRR